MDYMSEYKHWLDSGVLTAEEKAEISHRGRALAEFAEKLGTYLKK